MITLSEQIRKALDRGKSDKGVAWVWDRICRNGRIVWNGDNSISWHYPAPDECEVMHAHGDWDKSPEDVDAFMEALGSDMWYRGAKKLSYVGRPGWARFLQARYGD